MLLNSEKAQEKVLINTDCSLLPETMLYIILTQLSG